MVDVLFIDARRGAARDLWTELDLLLAQYRANSALPITGPLAALCLLLALAVKLSRRVDDDVTAYRLATAFLVLGATLYYFPLVFAVEATSQVHLSWFITNLTSDSNVTPALWIMWISLVGVALVAAWLFMRALASANRSMGQRLARPQPSSRVVASGTAKQVSAS
jgi:hypothetical protein